MQIAQKLYEGVNINGEQTGLITYANRGTTIAGDAIAGIRDVIASVYGNEFLPEKPRMFKSKAKNASPRAIRPTNISITPNSVKYIGRRTIQIIRFNLETNLAFKWNQR